MFRRFIFDAPESSDKMTYTVLLLPVIYHLTRKKTGTQSQCAPLENANLQTFQSFDRSQFRNNGKLGECTC